MKEIMAIIRMDMINTTKDALVEAGFMAMNCKKVLGRGKKKVDFEFIEMATKGTVELSSLRLAEYLSEGHRLISKRLISIVVKDENAQDVVNTIIKVNSKGKAGDGKIFVVPVSDVYTIRTGEWGEKAI